MKWKLLGGAVVIFILLGLSLLISETEPVPPLAPSVAKTAPPLPSVALEVPSVTLSMLNPEKKPRTLGAWLTQEGYDLNPQVVDVLESVMETVNNNMIEHTSILTLIDYSIPGNKKRLWVMDLDAKKVLFYTYVSHGIKSGTLESNFFSNRFDSKASSIGVYRADKPYYGRHGLSLKLDGLDRGFNDNADSRAIVMHGGWYVEENFIQKYGRAGRSWGCPAVPDQLITPIIDTIKYNSIVVIYYPDMQWFEKSKFIQRPAEALLIKTDNQSPIQPELAVEEDILLAQLPTKKKHHESEAILVTSAACYRALFNKPVPLQRMLRRQIQAQEYVALSKEEFEQLVQQNEQKAFIFQDIYFVVPEIKMVRGYYATEMNKLPVGKIMHVSLQNESAYPYVVTMDTQSSFRIKTSHQFIRWLGL